MEKEKEKQTEIQFHNCLKCGHNWASRLSYVPVVCARCKKYNWNKDSEENKNE